MKDDSPQPTPSREVPVLPYRDATSGRRRISGPMVMLGAITAFGFVVVGAAGVLLSGVLKGPDGELGVGAVVAALLGMTFFATVQSGNPKRRSFSIGCLLGLCIGVLIEGLCCATFHVT